MNFLGHYTSFHSQAPWLPNKPQELDESDRRKNKDARDDLPRIRLIFDLASAALSSNLVPAHRKEARSYRSCFIEA